MYHIQLEQSKDGLSTDIYTARVKQVIKEGGIGFLLTVEIFTFAVLCMTGVWQNADFSGNKRHVCRATYVALLK